MLLADAQPAKAMKPAGGLFNSRRQRPGGWRDSPPRDPSLLGAQCDDVLETSCQYRFVHERVMMGALYFPIQCTDDLNRLYQEFLTSGKLPTKQTAKGSIPSHYHNYKVLGVDTGKLDMPDENAAISENRTKLVAYCSVHDWRFITTIRSLFATAAGLVNSSKCPACQGTVTISMVRDRLLANEAVDFLLDEENLEPRFKHPHHPVSVRDMLPVICRRNRHAEDEPCGTRKKHRWSNLSWTLERDVRHLTCQGPCDSKNRGKSTRAGWDTVAQEIADARAGVWKMTENNGYRKKSEECWLQHIPCGGMVFRMPATIINYAKDNNLAPNTYIDCPYCTRESAYYTINNCPEAMAFWVSYITEGTIGLAEPTVFPGSVDAISVVCHRCNTQYKATQQQLRTNVHFGCEICHVNACKQPRAWVFEDAYELVDKRGFRLASDPQSYTVSAEILTQSGEISPYRTIQELLNALPVHATEDSDTGATKRKYRLNDNAFSDITARASYMAGIIASDGWVTGNKLKIALQAVDEDVIKTLLTFVSGDHKVQYKTRQLVQGRNIYAEVSIGSKKIIDDLKRNFHIDRNKSLTQPAPNLPDECKIPFLVGLIEGDGSVRVLEKDLYKPLIISFVCASKELIEWVHRTISDVLDLTLAPPVVHVQGDAEKNTVWRISVMRENAEKLGHELLTFPGAMQRKWKVLSNYLEAKRLTQAHGHPSVTRQSKFLVARQRHDNAKLDTGLIARLEEE